MAESPQQERLRQDLGLGGKLSERSRARLLNHDGTFNVRRNDLGPFHPYNAYHTLLSLPVPRLLGLMAAVYVVTNVFFAALYWLAGPDALAGAAQRAAGALRRLPVLQRADARDDWLRPAGAEHARREHPGRARGAGRPAGVRHPQRPAVRALHASDREDQSSAATPSSRRTTAAGR